MDRNKKISKKMTGMRIYSLMRQKDITVSVIQDTLELECPQSIYKWLNGTSLPSVQNLYLLSKLLDIPMGEILVTETTDNIVAPE